MTNWGFDDGQTTEQGNNYDSPGGLRQFAEKTQQENKALKDQLAEIQKTLKTQSVQTVFNELGVPSAASQYDGEADPDKIKSWVDNQRKVFGVNSPGTPVPEANVPQPTLDTLSGDVQQQLQQFTEAGQMGQPLGTVEQAYANVGDAKNLQDLLNAMNFGR